MKNGNRCFVRLKDVPEPVRHLFIECACLPVREALALLQERQSASCKVGYRVILEDAVNVHALRVRCNVCHDMGLHPATPSMSVLQSLIDVFGPAAGVLIV